MSSTSTTGTPGRRSLRSAERTADRRVDPQPRVPGHRRRIVARPDRARRDALRVVGRHEPAVGCAGARRPDRRRVTELRHRDPDSCRRLRSRRTAPRPERRARRHHQRHRHRRVGSRNGSAPRPRRSPRSHSTARPPADRHCSIDSASPTTRSPLATVVTRLTEQKGIDLLVPLDPAARPDSDAPRHPRIGRRRPRGRTPSSWPPRIPSRSRSSRATTRRCRI